MRLFAKAQKLLFALVFPEACAICDCWVANLDLSPLCGDCLASLSPMQPPFCETCGVPVPGDILNQFAMCSSCREGTPLFDMARAWGLYEGKLRHVVRQFKFKGRKRLAKPLAKLLKECYSSSDFQSDCILPVPSHKKRVKTRGFDQTALLAQNLSRELGIQIFNGLSRIKNTKPQFGLALRDRSRNVLQAFQLVQPDVLNNKDVLLVDDIVTTGATVQEISRLLHKEAKPRRIDILTVARAARRYPM